MWRRQEERPARASAMPVGHPTRQDVGPRPLPRPQSRPTRTTPIKVFVVQHSVATAERATLGARLPWIRHRVNPPPAAWVIIQTARQSLREFGASRHSFASRGRKPPVLSGGCDGFVKGAITYFRLTFARHASRIIPAVTSSVTHQPSLKTRPNSQGAPMPLDDQKERNKALDIAVGQIEKQFGKGSIMRLGQQRCHPPDRGHLHRLDQHRLRARHRRPAARPRGRDLRTGVVRQDHAGAAGDCRSAEGGRHGRVRGRGACARRAVRAEARRRSGQPAGVAARQRRAGARDRRGADPLQQRRRRRRGLGGRAGAEGRNRRRDGRRADGPAGAPDVAGAAQADRRRLQVEHHARSSSTSCARRSA